MSNIGKAAKQAAKGFAKAMEGAEYEAAGKKIQCPHCASTAFATGEAQLNTAVMSLLSLDWLNKSATTLICANCGNIQWFLQAPTRL